MGFRGFLNLSLRTVPSRHFKTFYPKEVSAMSIPLQNLSQNVSGSGNDKPHSNNPHAQNQLTRIGQEALVNPHPIQTDPSRCWSCRKKVALLGFKCRCDYIFCASHRPPETHHCTFDYKQYGRELSKKNNPRIVGAKIQHI